MRAAELTGIWIPEEYGGHGAGLLNLCVVVEEISRACGAMGLALAVVVLACARERRMRVNLERVLALFVTRKEDP